MAKTLLVLTGSYRKNGNSALLAEQLIQDAKAKGYETIRFDTAFLNIGECHHCNQCFKKGNACAFDDDFNRIADILLKANAIAFVTPLYWYSWPSSLKALIDRFYSLYSANKLFQDKKTALFAVCGDGAEGKPYEGLLYSYDTSMALLKADNVGHALFYDLDEPGAIADALRKHPLGELEKRLLA
jgi:multimeric flavodoxin WrbA